MAPGLHGELARAAEREGVSLNGYITTRLAEAVGWGDGERPTTEQPPQHAPSRAVLWALVANAAAVVLAAVSALLIVLVAILW
jgi:hypothetical protein